MKKLFKKAAWAAVMFALIFHCFSVTAFAAGSIIAFSKKSLTVGESFTVTVTVDGGEPMYAVEAAVTYNPDVLQFVSGDSANGSGGSITIVSGSEGSTKKSYNLNFTAVAAGTGTVSVSGTYVGDDEKPFSGSSASVTVTNAAASSNASLSSLTVNGTKIALSASRTSYTATVPYSVETCAVTATPADPGAKVSGGGNIALKVGKNTCVITVTAPSGTTKNYTITITRQEENANTSSETPSSVSPGDKNPYLVTINNQIYNIVSDISGLELFGGFTASTAVYNDTEVPIASDVKGEFKIFYLKKDGEEKASPYIYDEDKQSFTPLRYLAAAGKTYILVDAESSDTPPEGYLKTVVKIGDSSVKGYVFEDILMNGISVIRCYSDGKYGYYRYDSTDGSIQRDPLFKPLSADLNTPADKGENLGLIAKIGKLSGGGKVIVLSTFAAILLAVVLAVLLIVKLIKGTCGRELCK